MTILRDISVIWSLVHVLVLFVFLYESRYPKKKTLILTLSAMIPLLVLNIVLFIVLGPEKLGTLILVTCTLPSLIFFWFMSKHRDGRFFFTFCMVDTVSLEIMCITNIIDYYIPGETYIFMFVVRLVAFPLLEWFTYKWLRPTFLEVQRHTKKGWYTFAAIGAIFYVVLSLSMSYPTLITERPEYLPALILLFILMPVLYINIFNTLRHQQELHEVREQEDILRLQVENMNTLMEEFYIADEKFRMERHDFKHKLNVLSTMLENKEFEALDGAIDTYRDALSETVVRHYCQNAIIDAVLCFYQKKAEEKNIKLTTAINLPDTLEVNEAEFATVFANAIENAVNACEKIKAEDRYIDIQVLNSPRFMMQISNSFNGEVTFDKKGIPVSNLEGHGLGVRSIAAFCEKRGALYEFKADGERFSLRIVFE